MKLSEIIVESSEAALALQTEKGSFPPGHNGPYFDQETPVRNTAHWVITQLKAWEITGDDTFRDSAQRAACYLTASEARPMGASFFCRRARGKDFCNGLIGQAWVIEALAAAGDYLSDTKYYKTAEEVFLMHPFDEKIGLWKRVNVDGSVSSFDGAFNHQLWFAAAGAMLSRSNSSLLPDYLNKFLDQMAHLHLQIDRSGRIIHCINLQFNHRRMKGVFDKIKHPAALLLRDNRSVHKEIGYHSFNLYALSILYKYLPDHSFWSDRRFTALLAYVNNSEFIQGLSTNKYAYPYNPAGFEVSFALESFQPYFSSMMHSESWWLEQQFKRCYNKDERMMNRNTEDPLTLAARLYEATRLQDMDIDIAL